ncbi:MAG: MFS transporter [Planctomycetota bacterium]
MSDASERRPAVADVPLWRNLSFTLMWTSTAASGFGDRMIQLAALALLGGLAAEVDSTSINAGTQVFFFAPYIFFSVLGGWLADRLPRKWLLLACDEARGLLLLASYFMLAAAQGLASIPPDAVWFTVPVVGLDVLEQWKVYALLFAIGGFASIFNPTRGAIVPQIVGRSQLQPANAIVLLIGVVFSMIGMVVGGQIISQEDASTVRLGILLGALFYLVSGTFYAFMKPRDPRLLPHEVRRKASISFTHALRYAARHRRVVYLIGLDVLVWGAAAAMSAGVIGITKLHYNLAGDELMKTFTAISATLGVGMLVGALVISLIRTRQEAPVVVGVALGGAGLNVLLFALVPWLPASYLFAFLTGVCGNVAIVAIISLLQSIAPNRVRGSVMGLNAMVTTMFSVLIYLAIWRMDDADRLIFTVFLIIGPGLVVAGGLLAGWYLVHGPMPSAGANLFRHGVRLFCLVVHRLRWTGRHHIPADGPVILAANHTTALDPFLIQSACPRQVRWLMLTSYRFRPIEFFWRIINPVFIDEDPETGRRVNAAKQVRQIVRHLKDGDCLGIFPEGHLQYDDRVLKPFEDGVAVTARLAKAAIVPVWVEGTVRSRNMLAHFFRPGRRRVAFGAAFTPDPKADPAEVTAELRQRMLALASPEARAEASGGGHGGASD